MPLDLKTYYLSYFRKDIEKIKLLHGNRITNKDDFFFDRDSWINAILKINSNEQITCFILSMFITVASDQTMFTYYKPLYGQFKLLTQYPKFGWCGLGPHNENPLLLIRYPIEKSLVEFKEIEKNLIQHQNYLKSKWKTSL
ncbi:MAG: hypothetical protein HQL61_04145 [Magnetococcales bacterium]|nr:hypothetical protein [Nitrospirota bacterium]